jgi:transposase
MIPPHTRIFVCTEPVDMRRSFDGLALAARQRLGHDPLLGGLFVFVNHKMTRLKIIWLDVNGLCILYKRLHRARFVLPPPNSDLRPLALVAQDVLASLLRGVPLPPRRRE